MQSPEAQDAQAGETDDVVATLRSCRLVPVVVIDDPAAADGLASSLVDGGLPVAEVTLRTPGALSAIDSMAVDDRLLVGAGTVLTAEQAVRAIEAGARFVVSPGLDESILEACRGRGVLAVPGVATATELQRAVRLGATLVKFFPAEAIGGVGLLKALSGPFQGVQFMPTGGVSPANVGEYLQLESVLACGGSWMAPRDRINDHDFDTIRRLVSEAVELASGF